MINHLIRILSEASDKYGNPYLLGFMEQFGLAGLYEATIEQLKQYIAQEGLL